MKSKAPLALMEQVIMLLVFSLAAAVCVQAFVLANRISTRDAVRDQAVLKAETVAEVYKNCRGNGAQAEKLMGGSVEKNVWITSWDGGWNRAGTVKAAYRVSVTPKAAQTPLGRAAVIVSDAATGNDIFTLEIAWQEAG